MGYYDVVGNTEIMGDAEIIGALRRAGLGLPRAGLAAAAHPMMQTPAGSRVVAAEPSRSRRMPLPVDSGTTLIVASAASTISVQPPSPYRPEKFAVAPVSAPNFLITAINIGRMNQLLGTGALDATLLSAENPENYLQFDTAQTSVNLSVAVTNQSLSSQRFLGAFYGTLVE